MNASVPTTWHGYWGILCGTIGSRALLWRSSVDKLRSWKLHPLSVYSCQANRLARELLVCFSLSPGVLGGSDVALLYVDVGI